VNPYFRAVHSANLLDAHGISLVSSLYANSSLDVPALPGEIYSITSDKSTKAILDVGGDDRGALALGRIAKAIEVENDFDLLLVINMYRPLSRTASDTFEIMREIERACRLKFSAIINNSNLGAETTASTVLNSMQYADEVAALSGLPIALTTVRADLFDAVAEHCDCVFPLSSPFYV
jgi:hypothetical protein